MALFIAIRTILPVSPGAAHGTVGSYDAAEYGSNSGPSLVAKYMPPKTIMLLTATTWLGARSRPASRA